MIICYDLDGTLSEDPDYYRAEMDGMRAAGNQVHVLSAVEDGSASNGDLLAKSALLHSLGLGGSYDRLAVVDGPHKAIPDNKVTYMKAVGASHLVDNRKANVKAAAKAGFTGHYRMEPKNGPAHR